MKKRLLLNITTVLVSLALVGCSSMSLTHLNGFNHATASSPTDIYGATFWEGNTRTTWEHLQRISRSKLMTAMGKMNNETNNAWVQLAFISKQYSSNTNVLVNQLLAWRSSNPSHPANSLFPDNQQLQSLLNNANPKHITLLLPLSGPLSASGKAVREGFLNAYYAGLNNANKQSVSLEDTSHSTNMLALYQQALSHGADMVIGPLDKNNVQQLSQSGPFTTPILALNYTETGFRSLPDNFYEFGLLPEDEIQKLVEKAHAEGLSKALVIAPPDAWGHRLVAAFNARWRSAGGSIQDTWYYTNPANFSDSVARLLRINPDADKKLMDSDNNKATLSKQRRQDFDVIFLFAQPQNAVLIVPLLKYYYASDIRVYATANIYSGNPAKDVDLNGVTICDIPWNANNSRTDDTSSGRLYAVGKDAYFISQSLQRMNLLPNFPVYGMTGAMILSSKHQIHRRIPCTMIQNGHL